MNLLGMPSKRGSRKNGDGKRFNMKTQTQRPALGHLPHVHGGRNKYDRIPSLGVTGLTNS